MTRKRITFTPVTYVRVRPNSNPAKREGTPFHIWATINEHSVDHESAGRTVFGNETMVATVFNDIRFENLSTKWLAGVEGAEFNIANYKYTPLERDGKRTLITFTLTRTL